MINASIYSQCPDMPVCYRRPLWPPGWRWWGQWCPPQWGTRTGWWSRPPGWSPRRSAPSSGAAHCHWPDLRSLGPGHREWRGPARKSTGQRTIWLYIRGEGGPDIHVSTGQSEVVIGTSEAREGSIMQRTELEVYTSEAKDSPNIYRTDQDMIIFLRDWSKIWLNVREEKPKNNVFILRKERLEQYRFMDFWGERPLQDNDNKWIYQPPRNEQYVEKNPMYM